MRQNSEAPVKQVLVGGEDERQTWSHLLVKCEAGVERRRKALWVETPQGPLGVVLPSRYEGWAGDGDPPPATTGTGRRGGGLSFGLCFPWFADPFSATFEAHEKG